MTSIDWDASWREGARLHQQGQDTTLWSGDPEALVDDWRTLALQERRRAEAYRAMFLNATKLLGSVAGAAVRR